jgi:guanidinopropionase
MPLVAGGDHLITLPVLRALAQDRPLGLVHFDAHTDLFDSYFNGCKFTHGTPFRLAIEEGLLDPKRMIQIGMRGTRGGDDVEWGLDQGIRIVTIEEHYDTGFDAIMKEACRIVDDAPAYLFFDIDCIDPSVAPGTGTPKIGGFNAREAQKMVRGLSGLNLVGADLVEVSPPFDQSGGTAWVGLSMMFEILCLLVEARAQNNA